jgi:flagella synthesis protein FlgN
MDQDVCREHLTNLLIEEASSLTTLATLLEREYEVLIANDVTGLEIAIKERQSCVGKIVRLEDERRSLCRMLGHESDMHGLEKLLRWCDPAGTLVARWAECAAGAARCQTFNDRNGALVRARLIRVQTLLAALGGPSGDTRTYGPGGTFAVPRIGRVLTAQA